ncbi:rod shape-determining protein RodA [Candidatus Pelagibacter sp.]|nr:rod shape-determining protein RodA [Candidatus Pelagibacter sp.]
MFQQTSYSYQLTFFQKVRSLDFWLIFCILALGIIGTFSMYSSEGGEILFYTKSHIIRFVVFFTMMIFLSFIRIKFWHSLGYFFYFFILLLLIYASLYGITASGSQRWINLYFINLQPSELMKIAIIVCFAKFYHRIQITNVNSLKNLLIPITILLIPIFLVLSQPDLGTSILIALSGIVVIWLSGVNIKYFFYTTIISIISMPFIISFLKPYQKLRILTFFDPEKDPLGAGYQIIQSKIAVGSGGLGGKGFLKGTQSYLEFLPEKHTDFIFTLYSEEFGFLGSVAILLIYSVMIYRIISIGTISRSFFSRLYCYGFASAIFIYIVVNMSMVLGLLPIVGSPLPIMSYGGSSMLATMIGLSIVMSAKIYHQQSIA